MQCSWSGQHLEVNNYGFEMQKSPNQPNNYQTISNSFVPGHGTTNVPHDYSFTDTTASIGVWYYRLKQIDLDGTVHYSDGILVDVLTDVEESPFPTAYSLNQNYPNPFNPSTTIEFALPNGRYVSLKVFNVLGKEVATLVSSELSAGRHKARLDASDLPSGTYFYRLFVSPVAPRDIVRASRDGQASDPSAGLEIFAFQSRNCSPL